MKRRDFFTKGLPSYVYRLGSAFKNEAKLEEKQDYFESFESCYPYLAEVSMDLMIQAAERLEIETMGKTKLELAREISIKQNQNG
jgi:Zn/Cd-binding protein ZinT